MSCVLDWRPGTAHSCRNSDIVHDRLIQQALQHRGALQHEWEVAAAYEQMEDFDHKMGIKMKRRGKVRVDEQRMAKEQEERTMGMFQTAVPREPSPIQHYEYGPVESHKTLNLDALFQGGGSSQRGGSRPWTTQSGSRTSRDSPRRSPVKPASRSTTRAEGKSEEQGVLVSRPGTYDSARSVEIVTHRTMPLRLHTARGRMQGVGGGKSDIWTPQSMIEPIFMPASCAQRLALDDTDRGTNNQPKKGKALRWEDTGPGRQFLARQQQILEVALEREERKRMMQMQMIADDVQSKRSTLLHKAYVKRESAFITAHRRGEIFPRAKIKNELDAVEQGRREWQERESKRLSLGMKAEDVAAEAVQVSLDLAEFEVQLRERTVRDKERLERSKLLQEAMLK